MMPFTPRGKKALELSMSEAVALGHRSVGAEHILLGVVRQGESTATGILLAFDVNASAIRHEVARMLAPARREDVEVADLEVTDARVGATSAGAAADYGPSTEAGRGADLPVIVVVVLAGVAFLLGLVVGWLVWG